MVFIILKYHLLLWTYFYIVNAASYSYDYLNYGDTGERNNIECKSKLNAAICSLRCGILTSRCLEDGLCYCVANNPEHSTDLLGQLDQKYGSLEAQNIFDRRDDKGNDDADFKGYNKRRPTVRHNIAHFCLDMDFARNCIKICNAKGKPAYCGKDQVCYCGHRYSNNDIDDEKKLQQYIDFEDMYKKYFDPSYDGRHTAKTIIKYR